jgi:hypothetical protein
MGLYEDNQSKIVRDHVAESIRNASIMIHNDALMYDKCIKLLELAIKLSGTESIKDNYRIELRQIKERVEDDKKNELVLQVPKVWSDKSFVFRNDYMVYNDKKIYYVDVIAISYCGTNTRTFGLSNSLNFIFTILSHNDKISVSFSTKTLTASFIRLPIASARK